MPGAEWCWSHDPARAEERRRNASRGGRAGGRGRGVGEIAEIKSQLRDLTAEVLSGAVPTARYAVANQLINTRLRAVELERKAREQEELIERIEELERTAAGRRGGERWGA